MKRLSRNRTISLVNMYVAEIPPSDVVHADVVCASRWEGKRLAEMRKIFRADNHIRYDHASRAKRLHVQCPKCNSRAEAYQPSQTSVGVIAHDCTEPWYSEDWSVVCERCFWRASDLAYSELPELYYQVAARGVVMWAWNRDHLTMLRLLLSGDDISGHRYEWFATYAQQEWLKQKNRKHLLKATIRVLKDR